MPDIGHDGIDIELEGPQYRFAGPREFTVSNSQGCDWNILFACCPTLPTELLK